MGLCRGVSVLEYAMICLVMCQSVYVTMPWHVFSMMCYGLILVPWSVCCSAMECVLLCHGVCVALPWRDAALESGQLK